MNLAQTIEAQKLTVLSGLPGAGKSSLAGRMYSMDGTLKIVGRDVERLYGESESDVTTKLVDQARQYLVHDKSVVIDSPNLEASDRSTWEALAKETGAEFEWLHLNTPVAVCISRDAQRNNGIGANKILQMARELSAGGQGSGRKQSSYNVPDALHEARVRQALRTLNYKENTPGMWKHDEGHTAEVTNTRGYKQVTFNGPSNHGIYLRDRLYKLQAGGPGSGCTGDNCGRPATKEQDKEQVHSLLGQETFDVADSIMSSLPEKKYWSDEGRKETLTYLVNSIQRGKEEIKKDGIKLKEAGKDIEITLKRIEPDKVHLRGDERYGTAGLSQYLKESGKLLPPIQIGLTEDRGQHLLDGHHRFRAYVANGDKPVAFVIRPVDGKVGECNVRFHNELEQQLQAAEEVERSDTGKGWVGVDFDGTLVEKIPYNETVFGAPKEKVVNHIRKLLRKGTTVKLFTARGSQDRPAERIALKKWMKQHLGQVLPITCEKDMYMTRLIDDRSEHPDSIHALVDILHGLASTKDTGKYDEVEEASRRTDAKTIGYYAEKGTTYDPAGKYLCGTCKARVMPDACAWVSGKISMTTGSCFLYKIGPATPADEAFPDKMTQQETLYTERPHVKGFGCSRCEYGAEAKAPDSQGRPSWCNFWGMHIEPKACCMKNTGKDDHVAPSDIKAGGEGSGCKGSNCGRPRLYHGTSSDRIDSINKEGIRVKKGIPAFTDRKDEAIKYAKMVAEERGSKPVLVTLKPESSKHFDDGKTDVGHSSYRGTTLRRVRPEHFESVEHLEPDYNKLWDKTSVGRPGEGKPNYTPDELEEFKRKHGIEAGGPGSGRHPGFGKFKYTGHSHSSHNWRAGKTKVSYITAPGTHVVNENGKPVHTGFNANDAEQVLEKRYGIPHGEVWNALSRNLKVQAGGPGSGCKGSNCGRPSGAKGTLTHDPAAKEFEVRAPEGHTFSGGERSHIFTYGTEGAEHKTMREAREHAKKWVNHSFVPDADLEAGGPGSGRHKEAQGELFKDKRTPAVEEKKPSKSVRYWRDMNDKERLKQARNDKRQQSLYAEEKMVGNMAPHKGGANKSKWFKPTPGTKGGVTVLPDGSAFSTVTIKSGGPGSGRHKEVSDTVRSLVEHSGKKPYDINDGYCRDAACVVAREHPDATVHVGITHTYVEHKGKFYDAETPSGVSHPKDLPIYEGDKSAVKDDEPKKMSAPTYLRKYGRSFKEFQAFSVSIDPITTSHPPSLRNPYRAPVDDPRETDDKYLDVTKRKQSLPDRIKLLKRGMPAGDIPVKQTGVQHHMSQLPLRASVQRPRLISRPARPVGAVRISLPVKVGHGK